MFEIAERYARRGLYVFPIVKGLKVPPKGLTWRERSTTNPAQIEAWKKQYPECNWAVDCDKSDLCVLDVDISDKKNGFKALDELTKDAPLPTTFTVKTPRGGSHFYFKGKTDSGNDKLGKGLDVKSVGGYVLTPGSSTENGEYTILKKSEISEIPVFLSEKIGAPKKSKAPDLDVSLDLDLNILEAVEYLKDAPPSLEGDTGDENAYRIACHLKNLAIAPQTAVYLMLRYWYPRCEPNDKPEFIARKVKNAYEYSQGSLGSATIHADFKPVERPANDSGAFETQTDQRTVEEIKKLVIPSTDFVKIEFPPRIHFLNPWISRESTALIYGPAGIGKSWFVMSILRSIATGENFGPWKVDNVGRALYLDAEMPGSDLSERVAALGDPTENFLIYSDAYAAMQGGVKASIMDPTWRELMTQVLVENAVDVWALDNLASLTPLGDENDKTSWNPVNQWLLQLRFRGISTVMIHHVGKSGDQRGTSARMDNVDISIKLKKPDNYQNTDGARFETIFEKARLAGADVAKINNLEFQMLEFGTGPIAWDFTNPLRNSKREIMRLKSEKKTNQQISDELGCSVQNVGQVIRKGKEQGYIGQDGRLTKKGEAFVASEG